MNTAQYFIGADLGQLHDFTGIAVVERLESRGEWDPARFDWRKEVQLSLRHLERLPLGTPYTEVVEHLRHMTQLDELRGRCQLIVDGTCVGVPVVDMLRNARLSCGLSPVMITGGKLESCDKGYCMVPKRDLIVGLQVLMQQFGLRIASGMALAPVLVKEMTDMRMRISPKGNEQFGAWRDGEHDDLVLAVSLACWAVRKSYPHAPASYWATPQKGRIV